MARKLRIIHPLLAVNQENIPMSLIQFTSLYQYIDCRPVATCLSSNAARSIKQFTLSCGRYTFLLFPPNLRIRSSCNTWIEVVKQAISPPSCNTMLPQHPVVPDILAPDHPLSLDPYLLASPLLRPSIN